MMSPNSYPYFAVSQSDKPEQVKVKIRMSIQLYIKDPEPGIAHAVVAHIASLLACPKYINDIEHRCQLRKLEMHWRCLSLQYELPQ